MEPLTVPEQSLSVAACSCLWVPSFPSTCGAFSSSWPNLSYGRNDLVSSPWSFLDDFHPPQLKAISPISGSLLFCCIVIQAFVLVLLWNRKSLMARCRPKISLWPNTIPLQSTLLVEAIERTWLPADQWAGPQQWEAPHPFPSRHWNVHSTCLSWARGCSKDTALR